MSSHRTASPTISPSTHYHAVVCNSATCFGDRVITTPCPTPQGVTPHVLNLSPPHQATSRPQQHNQAPREHTPPSSAKLVSWEELHSAIANMFHNMQDMFTKFHIQSKDEIAIPMGVQPPATRQYGIEHAKHRVNLALPRAGPQNIFVCLVWYQNVPEAH